MSSNWLFLVGNDKAIEESRQQLDMIAAELEKLHTELHTYQVKPASPGST